MSASETLPRATHGSTDRPLKLGGVEIACYILDDGRRVLTRRGMLGGAGMFGGDGVISTTVPAIRFRTPGGGPVAVGTDATYLPDLCTAWLEAARAGKLDESDPDAARRCEQLLSGFARIGVIAIVDEATGYQAKRRPRELHHILSAHVRPELLGWTRRFPAEFYVELFRLLGWPCPSGPQARPAAIAHLLNRVVYERLPASVLEELQRLAPRDAPRSEEAGESSRPEPAVVELDHLLDDTIALMREATGWPEFVRKLATARSPIRHTLPQFSPDDGPMRSEEATPWPAENSR